MSNKIITNLIKLNDKSNGMLIGQESDSSYIKNYNNALDVVDRVFYTKENGEIFECFKNKPMEPVCVDELNDLIMHNRQKKISYIAIAELQVNELKRIFEDTNLKRLAFNYETTIKSYAEYGILSDKEFKGLIDLLNS